MEFCYDDIDPNPLRKKMSISPIDEEIWLDEYIIKFVYQLFKISDLTTITGKYEIKTTKEGKKYRLETYIYKDINFGEKYDSKRIFLKENTLFGDFLNNLKEYFWNKGWIHGDLSLCNYIIYYPTQKPKFKIFNFEFTQKYPSTIINTVGYFKFLWNEELWLLYFIFANMELNKSNSIWIINNRIFKDKFGKDLCILLNSDNNIEININKLLNYIIYHLKCFVYSENILLKDY